MPGPCSLRALGMINALGPDPEAIWPRLLAGDQSRFVQVQDEFVPGEAPWLGVVRDALPEIPRALARYACRNNALALAALQQIEAELRAALERYSPGRVAVVMATSTSGIADAEEAIIHRLRTGRMAPKFAYEQLEFGGAAGFVSDYLGTAGPRFTLSTACSSGARALASARSLLELGVCDAVIAGAADSLSRLTTNGFRALHLIAPSVTNPCSRNRAGLTIGEGAALFLVTRDADGVQLLGVGESCEGHHMSAPDPTGVGVVAAMQGALDDAGVAPRDVAYLNLHGTGTQQNDSVELRAVAQVFGTDLPCSSSKPLVGHTLGAAGAIEAAFCWQQLRRMNGRTLALIPHRWDGERDPELPALHLVGANETQHCALPARLMSNSFGFGGNNCSLILGEPA